jgi:hypothetical protein
MRANQRVLSDLAEARAQRAFYTKLGYAHASVVPVVGSGLTIEAEAPSFAQLIAHLHQAAFDEGIDSVRLPDPLGDPFEVVDAIALTLSEGWVQQQTAALFVNHPVRATPALCALAKVATGLIVTTNYDLSIERAAEEIGRSVITLTLEEFDVALQPAGEELRVLHLHGIAGRPETIVLTGDSYTRIIGSDRSQLVLRDLAVRFRLVFLGHRLAKRESHLRRDLQWAIKATTGAPSDRHLLITDRETVDDLESLEFKNDIENNSGVTVVMFPDPEHANQASVRSAHVIAGPSLVASQDIAPALGLEHLDRHYEPLPVADPEVVNTPGGMGAHIARTWQHGDIYCTDLDNTESCLVLVAAGGVGKSEELRQIARRSKRPALLSSLTGFGVDDDWGDPGAEFVACMNSACAVVRLDIPKLTLHRLENESYGFMLDGLDEVPANRRGLVIQLLNEVATAYPQHRFVVASRPVPDLKMLAGFRQWAPAPDRRWLSRYAVKRAVPIEKLDEALPETGDLSELIVIPIFAAAALDDVVANKPLPNTALELVWRLADRQTEEDQRTGADPAALRIWLDRLALLLELGGVTEMSNEDLMATRLHEDLPRFAPTPDLLAKLASRALLTNVDKTVRFPANVIQEARAARALLEAGGLGLEVLRRHVLFELPTAGDESSPVRAVRPSWVNTIEMLLPLAPSSWWDTIAKYDPALAARATPTTASSAHREKAIWTLWNTYVERKVWMERGFSSREGNDAGALDRLLATGAPDWFVDQVVAALSSPERTMRGNALQVLGAVLTGDELGPLLSTAIADKDAVVRRQAAMAAFKAQQTNLVQAMVDQAHVDDDKTAAETLITFAIDLTKDDNAAAGIALGAPASAKSRALGLLARRLPRLKVLSLLRETQPFNGLLFKELDEGSRDHDSRVSWTVEEVVSLAHLVAEHPRAAHGLHDIEELLKVHPAAAIVARTCHPVNEDLFWDIGHLAAGLDEAEVSALIELFEDPKATTLTAIGLPDGLADALDAGAVDEAVTYLRDIVDRPQNPRPYDVSSVLGTRAPQERLGDDADEPVTAAAKALPDAEEELRGLFIGNGVAQAFDVPSGHVGMRLLEILQEGATRKALLDPDDCVQLFTFLTHWQDGELEDWLQRMWTDAVWEGVMPLLRNLTTDQLFRMASFLPAPWPEELGTTVLEAADGAVDVRTGHRLTRSYVSFDA